jgi:hypothetical protein
MLHALAALDEVAIDQVDSAVAALDDCRVVVLPGFFKFQVASVFPARVFIF